MVVSPNPSIGPSSLLKQQEMAHALGSLPAMGETQMEFLAQDLATHSGSDLVALSLPSK